MKDLFRGYMFFKLIGLGVMLIFISIVILIVGISSGDIWVLGVTALFLLLGVGVLKLSHNIYKSEDTGSSQTLERYEQPEIRECPNCGSQSLQVYSDGAATCRRCDYSDMDHE